MLIIGDMRELLRYDMRSRHCLPLHDLDTAGRISTKYQGDCLEVLPENIAQALEPVLRTATSAQTCYRLNGLHCLTLAVRPVITSSLSYILSPWLLRPCVCAAELESLS